MYFKLKLEDGTEIYKDLDDDALLKILDEDAMADLIAEEVGESIEDWYFTERPSTYQNVIQLDISSAVIEEEPDLIVDDKKVSLVSLLQGSTYEHALATLSLTDPKAVVYSKNIEYTVADIEEYYDEDDGGYNDESPDYD